MTQLKEINGQLVLEDPIVESVIAAVEAHNKGINKENCKKTFEAQQDRVQHFKNRISERGLDPKDVLIVILNVDDPHGGPIADMLMPGTNWQAIRDKGEVPYARCLASREGMEEVVEYFDEHTARRLRRIKDKVPVLVVDYGVAAAFSC